MYKKKMTIYKELFFSICILFLSPIIINAEDGENSRKKEAPIATIDKRKQIFYDELTEGGLDSFRELTGFKKRWIVDRLTQKVEKYIIENELDKRNILVSEDQVIKHMKKLFEKETSKQSKDTQQMNKKLSKAIQELMNNENLSVDDVFERILKPAGFTKEVKKVLSYVKKNRVKLESNEQMKDLSDNPLFDDVKKSILENKLKASFSNEVVVTKGEIKRLWHLSQNVNIIKLKIVFSENKHNLKGLRKKTNNGFKYNPSKFNYKQIKISQSTLNSVKNKNRNFNLRKRHLLDIIFQLSISDIDLKKGITTNVLYHPDPRLYYAIHVHDIEFSNHEKSFHLPNRQEENLHHKLKTFKTRQKYRQWLYEKRSTSLKILEEEMKAIYQKKLSKNREDFLRSFSFGPEGQATPQIKEFLLAIMNHEYKKIRNLLKDDINVNQVYIPWGKTPLSVAVEVGNETIIENLLQEGANPNKRNKDGTTPLMIASETGRLDIVKKLLTNGARIEIKDNEGWTALMYASYVGQPKVVKKLIQEGVDLNTINKKGESAIDLAKENDREKVMEILQMNDK